jgi:hypothetical protein
MQERRVSGLKCELKIVMPEWKWRSCRLAWLARKKNQVKVVFDPNNCWNRTESRYMRLENKVCCRRTSGRRIRY